ncbi:MAG: mechanosensitive ion channel family protein [Gammaproteobacteria bacterium]|nr:MAG: mechanosensitive ion channel family protein [Gammaproteobacteria bacterium]
MKLAQAAVAKRMEVVLSELEKKGGDTKELRLYTDAFSGIEIDVSNTESAWLALEAWVTSDEGGLSMLVSIVKFVVAMIFVILLANLTGKIADRFTKISNVSSLLKSFIKVFARRIVLFIGFIASVSILGINIGPVLALIGAAGLVIGLALQNTLGNFASGILILLYRPFDMGDVVEVDGFTGTVNSMTLLSTSIKTFDNKFIVIPNNSVWNAAITNVTGSKTRRVDMVFGIGYDDDFTTAQKIIQTVLDDHPKVLNEPKPIVRMNELGDSSVNIICRPWTKTEDYWDVYWDVMEAVKYEFDTQGVTFPFPQQDVHLFPAK